MQHIIDHIGISVKDYERSKRFYLAALAPDVLGPSCRLPGAWYHGAPGDEPTWEPL